MKQMSKLTSAQLEAILNADDTDEDTWEAAAEELELREEFPEGCDPYNGSPYAE